MEVHGIIINEELLSHCRIIFPEVKWDTEYDEIDCIDSNSEDFQEALILRESALGKLTKQFLCGNENAKLFFFSDTVSGLDAIKKIYPEFEVITTDSDLWSFDYNYKEII